MNLFYSSLTGSNPSQSYLSQFDAFSIRATNSLFNELSSDLQRNPSSSNYNQPLGIQGSVANVVVTLTNSETTPVQIGTVDTYFTVVDNPAGMVLRMKKALRRDVSHALLFQHFSRSLYHRYFLIRVAAACVAVACM